MAWHCLCFRVLEVAICGYSFGTERVLLGRKRKVRGLGLREETNVNVLHKLRTQGEVLDL